MQRISITNPQNIIDGTAKKYYFKLRNTGGPKGDKGDKGDTGATGPQGPQGDPCTVVVNSTATLEPGSDAYVTNTGSLSNAVLNFGIPKGDQGPQGAKGDKGDTGAKGDTGPQGPQGERGTNATVYIGTTSTLAPGSQATVYNSGTENNAVLNFGIPQGAKGDTGPQGEPGSAGQNFSATVVTELPTTGDSSKLYLTPKNYTTGTATGNPITISLGEDAGQVTSFQLDGDTYQQSYTGKNLWGATTTNFRFVTPNASYAIGGGGSLTVEATSGTYQNATFNIALADGIYTFTLGSCENSNSSATIKRMTLAYVISGNRTVVSHIDAGTPRTVTISNASGKDYVLQFWATYDSSMANTAVFSQIQVEAGSTTSAYEPYVGGVPSPNPSYPQPIQTVTGEQTVEIVGKNLFDKDKALDNYFYTSTGAKSTYSRAQFYNNEFVSMGNKITMSFSASHDKQNGSNIEANVRIVQYDASGNFISRLMSKTNGYTFTLDANTKSFILSVDNGPDAWFDDLQVEYGASATSYAPYHATSYPISLGSIELCKLGTYQDYIYKDGDDWKVHKAIGSHTFDGSENWTYDDARIPRIYLSESALNNLNIHPAIPSSTSAQLIGKITNFTAKTFADFYTNAQGDGFAMSTVGRNIQMGDNRWTSMDGAIAEVIGAKWYYAQATGYATDTAITDQTLISQLETIRTASLQASNTITNTATAPNLAGDMELGYYEYNPTNRYDKWLWLDINNNYEQIGS